ncbi:MAG: DUF4826 family protein [Planctomycetota bacterium]|jgi:hypothetical protein
MTGEDWEDPEVREAWISGQRGIVRDHLAEEGFPGAVLRITPDWCLPPHLAIWRASVRASAGVRPAYVLTGDLPADHICDPALQDARAAMAAFAVRWSRASRAMIEGREEPELKIGDPSDREEEIELGDQIGRRARLLDGFAEDDSIWDRPAAWTTIEPEEEDE